MMKKNLFFGYRKPLNEAKIGHFFETTKFF